ncbi:MAG: Gfo/Idh/MocA family protein, partial [Planctomycetota bacterium]
MSSKTKYGIGMLGFGFIGKAHAYSHVTMPYFYDNLPFRARFVGVCTGHEETAHQARDEYGFEFCTTNAAEVIQSDEVDVVHICTPNSLHKEELLAAMDAGKHIYCDKPLVPTWSEAQDVLDVLPSYDGTHQMTLQYRFYPATMRAKQLVDEGFLGDITCFRASYLHSGSTDPDKPLGWKLDADMGGGVLNDLATHVVDLVQHLIGPFDSILSSSRILHPERPSRHNPEDKVPVKAEDHACLLIRNDDGLTGTIEASKIATGTQDELRFEIHGTRGAIRFNLM